MTDGHEKVKENKAEKNWSNITDSIEKTSVTKLVIQELKQKKLWSNVFPLKMS